MSQALPVPPAASRIASLDVLRALDILLMVFVNDLAATPEAPRWLRHIQPPDSDGMTVADVVFPAFLFIAGMSIPLAFERALARGVSRGRLLLHVAARTASLLALGVLMVNPAPAVDWPEALREPLWWTLVYSAMILGWCAPAGDSRGAGIFKWICRAAGGGGLICLAAIYRHPDGGWLRTEWWGILGLIGWAYAVAACLYLAIGRRRELLLGAGVLLMAVYLSREAGVLARLDKKEWLDWARPALESAGAGIEWINQFVSVSQSLGSLSSITVLGAVLGTILVPASDVRTPQDRVRWAALYALGLAAGAVLLDTFHGINKIAATPSWCLWSAALTVVAWLAIFWWLDVRGWPSPGVLTLTGSNPLLAYFLHPLLIYAAWLAGFTAHTALSERGAAGGLARSIVVTLLVALLTAGLTRIGLRLKL